MTGRLIIPCATLAACLPQPTGFKCATNADCVHAGVQGMCETTSFCSFPDPSCTDGRRYGDQSGSLAGQCVGMMMPDALPDTPAGTFRIGGALSGATDIAVLQDNGGDNLSVPSDGPFTFSMAIATGMPYAVSVMTPPAGQTCNVGRGSGTVAMADITDVNVTCYVPGPDNGVKCGTMDCNVAQNRGCCLDTPRSCPMNGATSCSSHILMCDTAADCVTAGFPANSVCCEALQPNGDHLSNTTCESFATCTGHADGALVLCDPGVATPCPNGGICTAITAYPSLAQYYYCQ